MSEHATVNLLPGTDATAPLDPADDAPAPELELRPVDGLPRWVGGRLATAIMRAVSMEEQDGRALSTMITPVAGYFRRDRHVHPRVDPTTYQLELTGVARPGALTLAELAALPREPRICVQECAGNGNHLMGSAGLMGQARWEGPRLEAVLERCGGPGDATHFAFHGLDRLGLGPLTLKRGYHYGLSLDELTRARAIVALTMNGAPLSRRHGFPARLVVPRVYSMSHVKWLGRVEGKTAPHRGVHNTVVFTNKARVDGRWVRVQARWIGLKSLICHAQRVADGWQLTGCAWGGERPIAGVEISDDGGASWRPAELVPAAEFFADDPAVDAAALEGAWSLFTYRWRPPRPGVYRIGARARDDAGSVQLPDNDPGVRGHFNQTRIKWREVEVPEVP